MKPKNGFLLVELMIGLSLSTFFMLLIIHYIIEVKATQHKAVKRIESFSIMRNEIEKSLAKKYTLVPAHFEPIEESPAKVENNNNRPHA